MAVKTKKASNRTKDELGLTERMRSVYDAAKALVAAGIAPTAGQLIAKLGEPGPKAAAASRINQLVSRLKSKGCWPAKSRRPGRPKTTTAEQEITRTIEVQGPKPAWVASAIADQDPEVAAIGLVMRALGPLDETARARAMSYVNERLNGKPNGQA